MNSNYNALSVKLTRRMSSGLTFLVGYTYSHSIDDGSGLRTLGTDQIGMENSYCLECERGPSIFDQRQRLVMSALYQLPFGKGRSYLNHGVAATLIGGWDLGMIYSQASGSPVDITTSCQSQYRRQLHGPAECGSRREPGAQQSHCTGSGLTCKPFPSHCRTRSETRDATR